MPESVADTAERERVIKALEKRRVKGAGSLNAREISAIRKYESRQDEKHIRDTLANVPQILLLELLATDRRVILDWEGDGMPRNHVGGRRVTYDLFLCLPWLKARWIDDGGAPVVNTEARERWELARAEEKEIQVSRLKGELIPVETITRERVERIHHVKAALLALPRRVAPGLAAMDDRRKIENRLTSYVSDILTAFSRGVTVPDPPRKPKKKKRAPTVDPAQARKKKKKSKK